MPPLADKGLDEYQYAQQRSSQVGGPAGVASYKPNRGGLSARPWGTEVDSHMVSNKPDSSYRGKRILGSYGTLGAKSPFGTEVAIHDANVFRGKAIVKGAYDRSAAQRAPFGVNGDSPAKVNKKVDPYAKNFKPFATLNTPDELPARNAGIKISKVEVAEYDIFHPPENFERAAKKPFHANRNPTPFSTNTGTSHPGEDNIGRRRRVIEQGSRRNPITG